MILKTLIADTVEELDKKVTDFTEHKDQDKFAWSVFDGVKQIRLLDGGNLKFGYMLNLNSFYKEVSESD